MGIPPDSKVADILKMYKGTNELFIDYGFPPEILSITSNNQHTKFEEFDKATWKRAHELFINKDDSNKSSAQLYEGIEPNDICQGILGVGHFLATISATAEFPSRIIKCFITRKPNRHGVYSIRFFIQGEETEIIIDDSIPCFKDTNEPLFARPNGNEIWVLMMEKAMCKIYGSYTMAEQGKPWKAMELLLGAPAGSIIISETKDKLWEILLDADQRNFMMTATTNGTVDQDCGLAKYQAYTIISAYDIEGNQLLKLRNPFG